MNVHLWRVQHYSGRAEVGAHPGCEVDGGLAVRLTSAGQIKTTQTRVYGAG